MKKSIFDTIGFFNEKVYAGEIIEWQNKMNSSSFQIKKLDFVSADRRLHSSNFCKTNKNTEQTKHTYLHTKELRRCFLIVFPHMINNTIPLRQNYFHNRGSST